MPRTSERPSELPGWLASSEDYEPAGDRDSFIAKSMESVARVLSRMRLDGGQDGRWSPSAPVKMALGLLMIVLCSASKNFAFVLLLLAGTTVRMAVLPREALGRAAQAAAGASLLTVLVMLPAAFLGQGQSALLIGTKVFVSVSIAMEVALSTPTADLSGALRRFHVPNVFILTVELTLKSIVDLGRTAMETLCALKLRSVGRNARKGDALGGVGGVVLLKAQEAARDTSDAMRCRGFEGDYPVPDTIGPRPVDILWCLGAALVVAAFVYLEYMA